MDKNTITGIVLIFLIFIGFSLYNSSRLNKEYEKAVAAAEAEVGKGNLERARTYYVDALRYKPNQPEVLEKLSDLNVKLGITPEETAKDTTIQITESKDSIPAAPAKVAVDGSQFGVFAGAAEGVDEFITLENDKIELKISLKGGKV